MNKWAGSQVKLPTAITSTWAGEYEPEALASPSADRFTVTILIIYIISSPVQILQWLRSLSPTSMAPIGGILALLLTGTHFSVSSRVGFLSRVVSRFRASRRHHDRILNHCAAAAIRFEDARRRGRDSVGCAAIMIPCWFATRGLPAGCGPSFFLARHRFRFAASVCHVIVGGLLARCSSALFVRPCTYGSQIPHQLLWRTPKPKKL